MRSLCNRCQNLATRAAEQLKRVEDSVVQQQLSPFAKKPIVHIDFARVENYVQELRRLTEDVAVIVTQSLAQTQNDGFHTLSLRNDDLQSGLSTILRLLEHGGVGIKQDDSAESGPVQYCIDISTQSRLDSLNNIDTEPPGKPLQQTRLRRKTILDLLYFRQMSDRIEDVDIAYKKTLEWIFRDKEYNLAWSSFPDFLQSPVSDLPYWINGKAGSGKSTLLRFLIRHEKTLKNLRTWSANRDLAIGHFFSWNLGTTLQKTQTGLLQSLLYQILKNDQTLIHQVFPDLWHEIDVSKRLRLSPVSFKDVKRAFVKAIEASAVRQCFCFFVDGIDEFDEDHVHVADLLLSLAAPNLKFVLSSRPVDACLDRFDGCPKLRLQDLTAGDIQIYIDGRLSSHSAMLEVMRDEPKAAAELIHELKDRASGVFLWVRLVVTSLLDGLRKGDDIAELKIRLRKLPPDLSKLYASMLGKMDPEYSRQAATLFRLVRTASVLLDGQSMPTQFLAVASREFHLVFNGRPVGFETRKIVHWCRLLMRQLYSRCCGLIEVSPSIYTPDWWHADLENLAQSDRDMLSSHIQFLHRTVTEYLYQDHVWDNMVNKSSEASRWDPHENLAYAALHMMKISPLADSLAEMQAYQWAQILVRAVREFERGGGGPLVAPIDEMDLVLQHQISVDLHWSSLFEVEPRRNLAFRHRSILTLSIRSLLSFAAFVGLSQYVDAKLQKQGLMLEEDITVQQTLVQTLFCRSSDWANVELRDRYEVVSCLLEHGANPNETYMGASLWQCCLLQVGALDCQSAFPGKRKIHHRQSGRRLRFDRSSAHDDSQCTCDPQDVKTWSQIILTCLTAGAKRADIDYLAPFAQPDQQPQICLFRQLCQTLYQVKNRQKPSPFLPSSTSSTMGTVAPGNHASRLGTIYGTNVITGSATAHLGDEYTYGNKITHVHHNYFGAGSSKEPPLQALPAPGSIQSKSPDGTCSDDFSGTLAWFKDEASKTFNNPPKSLSSPAQPDFGALNPKLTSEQRTMIYTQHWRGEVKTWNNRRCGNEHCQTNTTAGWDYVPSLETLLCLKCYHNWRKRTLQDKDARDCDLLITVEEEIFNESFSRMSLVTVTNDSDDSDNDADDAPHDYQRGKHTSSDHTLTIHKAEPGSVSVAPQSASISIRPVSSAQSNRQSGDGETWGNAGARSIAEIYDKQHRNEQDHARRDHQEIGTQSTRKLQQRSAISQFWRPQYTQLDPTKPTNNIGTYLNVSSHEDLLRDEQHNDYAQSMRTVRPQPDPERLKRIQENLRQLLQ